MPILRCFVASLILAPSLALFCMASEDEAKMIYQPGGMWMPHQIAETHADTLKQMGLEIDPKVFADPLEFPLNAIVHLGGCSASFISPEGLVITNYHCVRGYLQFNSTAEQNLLEFGYLAHDPSEEIFAGPTARVYVTTAVDDITDRMLDGIAGIEDDLDRYNELEKREKEITKEYEENNPNTRCEVARFYGGGKFYMTVRLEIKDVRLVYAPHRGIGEFGGDIDNWMWPRHTGDFALLRAYVGPDGKPAEYSPDNVPFQPKAFLKIAEEGLKPGDLTFVVGYPGSTERLSTALEIEDEIEWRLPYLIALFRKHMDLLDEVTKDSPDLEIKGAVLYAGLSNMEKKWNGTLDGARRKDLVNLTKNQEKDLLQWIGSDENRKDQYGHAIPAINALSKESQKTREADSALSYIGHGFLNPLVNAAVTIVRMAEERPKPDIDRDPDYQERNWQRLQQSQERLQRNYAREISQAVLELNFREALDLPKDKRPQVLIDIFGEGQISDEEIHAKTTQLFEGTNLENLDERVRLLNEASIENLQKSDDALIQFALKLSPVLEEIKERRKRLSGAMVLVRPVYFQALEEFYRGKLAPDANGTIRISFGTVRGFRPQPDQGEYYPFTHVWEMAEKWAKHRGEWPFDAPQSVIDVINKRTFGPYLFQDINAVPIDFLTDLDITNGNSGSATLNARAEFTGIAFDGNIEGVASDLVFLEDATRAIHTDVRYIKWVLDAVEQADWILREMGVEPAFSK
ncbi:MAG: S46 family peptidase [Candidatus Omnitrophica bacterium]|nr:S46 family peptidase [Candidatus Omnitrophota bacterium]